jgi:hypothetical protein
LRTRGASTARSAWCQNVAGTVRHGTSLTLAVHAVAIDGNAADHDIVDDGEAALAADPIALAVPDATVGQHGGLVEPHASTMELLCDRDLLGMEEVPAGPIDDLIRGVAEDVDNRVGRVEDVRVLGEV